MRLNARDSTAQPPVRGGGGGGGGLMHALIQNDIRSCEIFLRPFVE